MMKFKQLGLILIALTWVIILGWILAPFKLAVFISFSVLFAANTVYFRAAYLLTWRKAFNECALGWVTIGLFILAIAELN